MSDLFDLQLLPTGDLILPEGTDVGSRFHKAFRQSNAAGILAIAAENALDENAPPALKFWANFGRNYLTKLCQSPSIDEAIWENVPPPHSTDFLEIITSAPPAIGMEYLSPALLENIWTALDREAEKQVADINGGLEAWLKKRHPLWRLVGRVTFHLAENKRSDQYPFAFLATYTHRLSSQNQLQYLPLGRALKQYSEKKDSRTLRTLLSPVQKAAEANEFAKELLDSRAVFQALPWSPNDAFRFLESVPDLEEAGIITKAPDWWKGGRPSRPQVRVSLDAKKDNTLGTGALLSFSVDVALGDETLTAEEWEKLLAASSGLVSIKGQWVEVDQKKLSEALEAWKLAERAAVADGIPFLEGMRLLAGFGGPGLAAAGIDAAMVEGGGEWTQILAGGQLSELLEKLRSSEIENVEFTKAELRADLRPYQQAGVNWLTFLGELGIGACLADDMGLGKTLQVIGALVTHLRKNPDRPSLLVVPASLVGNWRSEIEKFAPQLRILYAHPSHSDVTPFTHEAPPGLGNYDAVITTYSMLRRLPAISATSWEWLIIDEAQAIKNPGTAQTRSVKAIDARQRVALTGTPIENSVTDLWSLFDFLNPGLLGGASQFKEVMKTLRERESDNAYSSLRKLVQPYILRRLKSDPTIISDLPDKTEIRTNCGLVKSQAAIYQKAVNQLAEDLKDKNIPDIQRRGLVIGTLIRLKQICNHPGLITGSGNFDPKHSGKFKRLQSLAEEVASRGEKLLVFSQFREMMGPLSEYLSEIFGRPGLILHGGTAVKRRQTLVERFQEPTGPPFFVISLKAGGTGLNLTAASHVVHFDRWWNPAVENQATDRAYRIGQKRNVLVHKFVCPGTIEDKIDAMIAEKQELADDIIGDTEGTSTQKLLTDMSTDELLDFVALDVTSATF